MNTKHTPGPWTATIYGEVENAGGNTIAACAYHLQWQRPDGGIDSEELPYEANARLIAAAPEMYELLEQMEEDLMVAWACVPEEFARKFKQYSDNLKVLKAKIEGDE